ncbi:MAG: YdeI family protein [Patescibacteria group bacterium]
MKDVGDYFPYDKQDWRKWLELNHNKKEAVWLIFYKKKSSNYNLSWSEAVEEALCFGWIDSTKKTIDKERYMQYFSRRKPNSIWSRINKDKINHLTKQGLMVQAGMESVKIANQNGSWIILDDVEKLIIPSDLEIEFANEPNSKEFFLNFTKTTKKSILYWIISAKRDVTRKNRIGQVAKLASKNQKPKQFR